MYKTYCMKSYLLVFLLVFVSGYLRAQRVSEGSWVPVRQEMAGQALPPSAFEKQKLTVVDSNYTYIAESVDKGIVRASGDNKLDIYGKQGPNIGKHFMAIYKIDKESMTICYNLAGDGYPEDFETKGHPMYFLSVFKKVE